MRIIKIIFSVVLLNSLIFSQHITNTLGTSGLFKIKDAANTYFTLTQTNGYVELLKSLKLQETTDLNTGVIYKGVNRFIHNYEKSGSLGNNTFIGINSGNFTMGSANYSDGSSNTGIGYYALNKISTGYSNIAVGNNALSSNTSGFYNVAVGPYALEQNISGAYMIAIGEESLSANTTGANNIAIGYLGLTANTTGLNNIALGVNSLKANTIGWDNISIGKNSLDANIDGNRNVGIGSLSLSNVTGDNNTSVGYSSASNLTTGSNNTVIGYNSQPSSGTVSNQITLGNNQVTTLRCNTQTITSLSDARDKKNIKPLTMGLDFIMKLQPRQFNWDKREWYENNISDGSKTENFPTAGFIAQELDSAQNEFSAEWLKLVMKDNPDKWEATYGNLLPVIVKALQELKSENDRLKEENTVLTGEVNRIKDLERRIIEIEHWYDPGKNEETKTISQ